jgi:iron-sulfur cluster insertion protein
MLELTESCKKKIKDIIAEENNPELKLRVFVQGGGCSGFQYGFSLDADPIGDDDFDMMFDDVHILVDSMSAQYLTGASIDYKEDLHETGFVIQNPNAQTTCGCGSSFSPY